MPDTRPGVARLRARLQAAARQEPGKARAHRIRAIQPVRALAAHQRGVERQDHAGAARELRERIGQLAGGNLIRARRTGGGSRCGLRPGGGHAGGKRARASIGQHGDAAGGQRGAQTRMS
ncbi:hypothetical protein G6F24_015504 [Rhizopus arrhizus]|nr:hypothetical protein G6F24_015504 [Rhizopus arrhizus]